MHWKRMLLWSGRLLQDDGERVRTDLVRLIPFDVQIALTGSFELNDAVNPTVLNDIVTDWMNGSFRTKALNQGMVENNTSFQTVALERRVERRNLRQSHEEPTLLMDAKFEMPHLSAEQEARYLQGNEGDQARLLTASFSGVSLWERRGSETAPIDPELVELLQRATFLEDNQLLKELQSADDGTGLGSHVVDVRAFITPTIANPTGGGGASNQGQTSTSTTTDNLEIIIIIAIVVACMAFGLLMFAVVWAWRTDRQKRDAYKMSSPPQVMHRTPDGTGSESDYEGGVNKNNRNSPPREIDPQEGAYPESVISEDITESLTAYYKTGMGYGYPPQGAVPPANGSYHPQSARPLHHHPMTAPKQRDFNDGASMSSMDSYGYSLDGYAPSLSGGPTQLGYPVGPIASPAEAAEESDVEPATDAEDSVVAGDYGPEDEQEARQ